MNEACERMEVECVNRLFLDVARHRSGKHVTAHRCSTRRWYYALCHCLHYLVIPARHAVAVASASKTALHPHTALSRFSVPYPQISIHAISSSLISIRSIFWYTYSSRQYLRNILVNQLFIVKLGLDICSILSPRFASGFVVARVRIGCCYLPHVFATRSSFWPCYTVHAILPCVRLHGREQLTFWPCYLLWVHYPPSASWLGICYIFRCYIPANIGCYISLYQILFRHDPCRSATVHTPRSFGLSWRPL